MNKRQRKKQAKNWTGEPTIAIMDNNEARTVQAYFDANRVKELGYGTIRGRVILDGIVFENIDKQ